MTKPHEHDPDSGMPRHKESAEGKDREKMEKEGGVQGATVKADSVVSREEEDRLGKAKLAEERDKILKKFQGQDAAVLDKDIGEIQYDVDLGKASPADKIKLIEMLLFKQYTKEDEEAAK